jgi:ADP-heptose:LPS heptosyltransferase
MTARPLIVVLSFRTFGDYVLKTPFLHTLFAQNPQAHIVLITNKKGGAVYPLLDSRLEVIVIDHGTPNPTILRTVFGLPRAEKLYVSDDSRTSLVLAMLLRAKNKTGWVQNISRLYGAQGYFDWTSVPRWLNRCATLMLSTGKIRRPEALYEGHVELELLDVPPESGLDRSLSEYRSAHAFDPGGRTEAPYIYCATEAGWKARQLSDAQWCDIAAGLLATFPSHRIVMHGAPRVVVELCAHDRFAWRVTNLATTTIPDLFRTIAHADLLIAPDSFALHVASLYDVPTVGYFGPAHPHRFKPTGPRSSTLFHQPACSPCLQNRGDTPCARGLSQCSSLSAMRADEFVEAARNALSLHHFSL